LLIWYRKQFIPVFLAMGLAGILNGFFYSITSVTFVLSIQNTSVANTLVILSSAPVFAAIFSTWFLSEKQPLLTWMVIGLSLLSIGVIAYGSLGQNSSITGDIFALLCAISTAASAVIVRKYRDKDLIGSIIIGCLIGCLFAVFYDPIELLESDQLLYLSLIGFLIVPAAFIMLTIAPRFIRSAEVQLIFLLEAILGPL
jgi:drug/metabolite transporter (DMT)-like permease